MPPGGEAVWANGIRSIRLSQLAESYRIHGAYVRFAEVAVHSAASIVFLGEGIWTVI